MNKLNLNNFKNVAKKVIQVFLFINIGAFLAIVLFSIGKPYPVQRIFMRSAEQITDYYINPLSKAFGLDNPLVLPFSLIRDGFYKIGWSLYPKDEGEKELWWWNIRFGEFTISAKDKFYDYTIFTGKKRYFTLWEIKKFHEWPEELYQHLEPLAFAKIKYPSSLSQYKYVKFLVTANATISLKTAIFQTDQRGKGIRTPITLDDVEFNKFKHIYDINEAYKKYAQKYDKNQLDAMFNDPNKRYRDLMIKHSIPGYLITTKYRRNELSCKDSFVAKFGTSYTEIKDFLQNNGNKLDPEASQTLDIITGYSPDKVAISIKCQNEPALKDYIKYIEHGTRHSICELGREDNYCKGKKKCHFDFNKEENKCKQ